MGNRKVLIVARDFVPYAYSFGNVVRVLKLAEFLGKNGVDVHVLAARGETIGFFGYEEAVSGMKVTYVDDFVQVQLNRMMAPGGKGLYGSLKTGSRGWAILKGVVNEVSVPDLGIFLAGRYVREALRIVRAHGIRNVLVTSPPHSAQVVGLRLKRALGGRINLIADYRDSWNTTRVTGRRRTALFRALDERLERKVLSAADRLTYVSRPILSKVNEKFFDVTAKATLVMNGFDAEMAATPPADEAPHGALRIGHFGFLLEKPGSHRDPSRLLRALERLGKKDLELHLYGNVSISREWTEKLKGVLVVREAVPHAEAVRLMGTMDLLLVLHSEPDGADEVLTGKLFEYMAARRPILVAGPQGMEAGRLVAESRLGYVVDLYDEDALAAGLSRIHEDWKAGRLARFGDSDLMPFSRQSQYAKILDLLR